MGRKVKLVMNKAIKAFYILMIAIVVFMGGLLISKGLNESAQQTMIEYQEGNAL